MEIHHDVPGRFKVVRHVREAFYCQSYETVVQATAPDHAITHGRAGPGLLAHITVARLDDHLPPYHQAEIHAQDGVTLQTSILSGWMGATVAAPAGSGHLCATSAPAVGHVRRLPCFSPRRIGAGRRASCSFLHADQNGQAQRARPGGLLARCVHPPRGSPGQTLGRTSALEIVASRRRCSGRLINRAARRALTAAAHGYRSSAVVTAVVL